MFLNFMALEDVIGFLAGVCTIFAFLPQVIKVVKTKSTESISIIFLIIMIIGVILWVIYGIRINNIIILVANSSTLLMSSIILTYKIKNIIQKKDKIVQ